ncbi:hypothetical protein B9G69_005995 [Bdellovibrio sp. SKB1291214]|uniref:hypothetical protein n=1 Tax=Bdellovibrio sp. SKB1291214 TaxID=1732569 RepID=UPI000B51D3BC|nr:hypothetical protein [Bdellovibrio sp. SKB1291214]UYL10129.1 hypothetical protein B9G69_005995 [Bdellovibrio sp. SKB1291214]
MKMVKFFVAALALTAVAGCKTVEIKDGRIPNAYLSKAKKYEGIYSGQFNGVYGELILSFEGNKPVLRYRNEMGTDILNNNCQSSFGNLRTVYITGKKSNPQVDAVEFDFDRGRCALMVQGRKMYVDFKEKNGEVKLKVQVLREMRQRRECQWYPGDHHRPPIEQCTWVQDAIYLYGTFTR